MAQIIDGKAIARQVRDQVGQRTRAFIAQHGRAPGLHVVLAGDDPASAVYVRSKEKAAKEAGIHGEVHRFDANVTQEELLGCVERLNRDEAVDGILVQLPLPRGIDEASVLKAVDPAKDVDGFHAVNVGALWSGTEGLVPCTPRGCLHLLKTSGVELVGKNALVLGRSNIVGKPIAGLLLREHATVTIAHSRTRDLPELCRRAEILVAAVGRPRMVAGDWVSKGAVVIDVGVNRLDNGKLCGDVDFEAAVENAALITKVPGGVGPMTIAMLLDNTVTAANARLAVAR